VRTSQQAEREVVYFVLRLMLIVLIVIGGVQLNTPPPSDQDTLDGILARMRNKKCEIKAIQKRTETRSQEMTEVRHEI